MSQKNFVSHGDAETVLTEFADSIKSKEPKIFKGVSAEWEALTAEEQAQYSTKFITDDETETNTVVDAVADGNMHPVTSNAVYDAIAPLKTRMTTAETKLSDIRFRSGDITITTSEANALDVGERILKTITFDELPSTRYIIDFQFGQNWTNFRAHTIGRTVSSVNMGFQRLSTGNVTQDINIHWTLILVY